jgi:hypothetical protein
MPRTSTTSCPAWLEAGARNRARNALPADRPGYPNNRCTARAKGSGKRCRGVAVNGWNVCRVHGAHRKKGELPKPSRDPAGELRRLERRVRRGERYAAMRERREEWRQEAATIRGFAQLSAADQVLIVTLLASDEPDDRVELQKAMAYLGLSL